MLVTERPAPCSGRASNSASEFRQPVLRPSVSTVALPITHLSVSSWESMAHAAALELFIRLCIYR